MKLRREFEVVRAAILNSKVDTLEAALAELSWWEKRLATQEQVDSTLHNNNTTFLVSQAYRQPTSSPASGHSGIGYQGSSHSGFGHNHEARAQFNNSSSGMIPCHFCQELKHIQPHRKTRNLCTYCKRPHQSSGAAYIM